MRQAPRWILCLLLVVYPASSYAQAEGALEAPTEEPAPEATPTGTEAEGEAPEPAEQLPTGHEGPEGEPEGSGLLETAPAPESPPEPPAPQGVLSVRDLAPGARLEVDGVPMTGPEGLIALGPGLHLVTVFPADAPPLEIFVEVEAGRAVSVRHEPGRKASEPMLAPGLLGASAVAAGTALTWWLLADRSALAATVIDARTDLAAEQRHLILEDLSTRERLRRDVTVGLSIGAAAIALAGVMLWISGGGEAPALLVMPHETGAAASWTVPID